MKDIRCMKVWEIVAKPPKSRRQGESVGFEVLAYSLVGAAELAYQKLKLDYPKAPIVGEIVSISLRGKVYFEEDDL